MLNQLKTTIIICLIYFIAFGVVETTYARERFFKVQSIDTMKYSRDVAREKLNQSSFDTEINAQVENIAKIGATHVAVATPYDQEFLPFLKRWVDAARKNNLKVWFRGNFSGWEKWFDYQKIDRQEHFNKTKEFILKNPGLFEDGDIFSSCPECENGGPGDPRMSRDITGFRNFIIEEYNITKQSFNTIQKKVISNYYSMNGDVARLIMDEQTTKALDGIVTIDHYVQSPDKLISDIKEFAKKSKGRVVLGEFGAPIPDIHGDYNEDRQARWVDEALGKLIKIPEVEAINYWTNKGSSTELWDKDNNPKKVVKIMSQYYDPKNVFGTVKNEIGLPLENVEVKGKMKTTHTKKGIYALAVFPKESIIFSKNGYVSMNIKVIEDGKDIKRDVTLIQSQASSFYRLFLDIKKLLRRLLGL